LLLAPRKRTSIYHPLTLFRCLPCFGDNAFYRKTAHVRILSEADGHFKKILGAIPLENMDLMVDPGSQTLVGAHGDEEVGLLL
jgi:hypothetical protein